MLTKVVNAFPGKSTHRSIQTFNIILNVYCKSTVLQPSCFTAPSGKRNQYSVMKFYLGIDADISKLEFIVLQF